MVSKLDSMLLDWIEGVARAAISAAVVGSVFRVRIIRRTDRPRASVRVARVYSVRSLVH